MRPQVPVDYTLFHSQHVPSLAIDYYVNRSRRPLSLLVVSDVGTSADCSS